MADGTLGVRQNLAPDRLIDNETVTIGSDTVYRQRVVVAGSTPAAKADPVNTAPAADSYGLPVRIVDETDLATETTLAAVLTAVDGLEGKDYATQVTLAAVLAEWQKRPTYKVANTLATVPNTTGGAFTTVAEVTPGVAATVEGYGTDLNGLASVTFRFRLITGTDATPTVIDMEQISAGSNSWRPVKLSVAANTRIAVQVVHGEVTGQDFTATVNYREGP